MKKVKNTKSLYLYSQLKFSLIIVVPLLELCCNMKRRLTRSFFTLYACFTPFPCHGNGALLFCQVACNII